MKDWLAKLCEDPNVDIYPQPVPVDYDPMDLTLPEAALIAKRLREYILAQPAVMVEGGQFGGQYRFDGSVPSDLFQRTGHQYFIFALKHFYHKPQEDLCSFEWQHSTPDYDRVIRMGLSGIKEEIASSLLVYKNDAKKVQFLTALNDTADTMILRAHHVSECFQKEAESATDNRKSNLLRAAEALKNVPAFPARTFYEAVYTIYFCFDMLPDSVGTIDRYLFPYYKRDIESGLMTREEAKDILQELFLLLNCHTPPTSENRKRGGECHFAIGGYTDGGEDGFTDLSRLIVEAIMELPLHIPEISLRWTKKTPREVLRFMMDCERHDPYKRIAFVNDEPRIKAFMKNLGLSFHDAIRYTMVGCNEPAFPGILWFGGITFSIMRSLTRTLREGRESVLACRNFEDFFAIYKQYLKEDLDKVLEYHDRWNALRAKDLNILSSLFLDGPSASGMPASDGGLRIKLGGGEMMGLTSLIDSLTVISDFIYDRRVFSMEDLLENLDSNWEKAPSMRTLILKTAPFFGNNEPVSNDMAVRISNTLYEMVKDRRLANGERILFGTLAGYHPHHVAYGNLAPASPDGRLDGEPFSVGSGQSFGRDRRGSAALLSSVAQMDPSGILSGPIVLNLRLDEKLIREDAYFEKTVDEIESYFKIGGMHVQLNYVSKEDLLAALDCPERYRSMKVRVSGWSGVFVSLEERLQKDIISRTEHES